MFINKNYDESTKNTCYTMNNVCSYFKLDRINENNIKIRNWPEKKENKWNLIVK